MSDVPTIQFDPEHITERRKIFKKTLLIGFLVLVGVCVLIGLFVYASFFLDEAVGFFGETHSPALDNHTSVPTPTTSIGMNQQLFQLGYVSGAQAQLACGQYTTETSFKQCHADAFAYFLNASRAQGAPL